MSLFVHMLQVGNADCLILLEEAKPHETTVVIDIPRTVHLHQWLLNRDIRHITRAYVTHDHADHFAGLVKFHRFAVNWLAEGRTIGRVVLPRGLLQRAGSRFKNISEKDPKVAALQAALDWFHKKGARTRVPQSVGEAGEPWRCGGAEYQVLWPTYGALENTGGPDLKNTLSLVLRVSYGCFAAMLLADLEGMGLEQVLVEYHPPASGSTSLLRAQLIKIPHHGAWPKNNAALEELLDAIDPEIALLSVGSRNAYQHVRPELFRALLARQSGPHRLRSFVCTELTRCCLHSGAERLEMGTRGLLETRPCAGDIEIEAREDGTWNFVGAAKHEATLQQLERAACLGRADLDP